jgi:osmoprotectant transport system ATP-binding protein
MADPPVVSLHSVTHRAGGTLLLDDVCLELPARETSAIIGESGSGKSSLLNHVIGLLKPDAGEVVVFGEVVDYRHLVPLRRRIGFAVQEVGLFPHLTVAQNLRLPARLEGWEEGRTAARVDELMATMELGAVLLDRYPHELSGGQRQRVGLCRAMMLAPGLLLLDEPFSGVDPINRRRIHAEFLDLTAKERVSVLLVTHDIAEARLLATQLVVMHAGRVLQYGPLAAVEASPADARVARLLQDAPG